MSAYIKAYTNQIFVKIGKNVTRIRKTNNKSDNRYLLRSWVLYFMICLFNNIFANIFTCHISINYNSHIICNQYGNHLKKPIKIFNFCEPKRNSCPLYV